jgi:hypothetical protein
MPSRSWRNDPSALPALPSLLSTERSQRSDAPKVSVELVEVNDDDAILLFDPDAAAFRVRAQCYLAAQSRGPSYWRELSRQGSVPWLPCAITVRGFEER